ncbi:MAG: class I tRNA ligase family protein, partial [Oscillospiraceae bacterium]
MYKKAPTDFNFAQREQEVLDFWNEHKIFQRSIENRQGNDIYTFYDGPPTANGMPHIGHVLTRSIKDVIPRYKTMKGFKVLRKAGWDTHGLPVELEVEKLLGLDGKEQIEEYGVEPFIAQCKKSVWKYEQEWRKMSERVGYWADMDAPYVTYHNNYIESEWWALKKIWEKNLLYKGHKIVPYCPRCGTSLSSHEVSQGYKDVTEKSVFIKFKAIDEDNTCYLAWTTTPWTLPSNVALAVNPNETYVYVNFNGETLVLAKALLEKVMSLVCENDTLENDYKIIKECTGKDLEYKQYQPLFDIAKPDKKAYYIVCADYVTMSDGCGIVHTAPAFGEDDATAGRMYDLPFVQMVNTKGEFISEVKQWAGMFVKDADPLIIEYLNENGFLFKALDYTHSYPFCWRCDTPLIYYARNTWFIEMTKVRDNLLKNNNTINWMPENIKNGRFGNFLENVVDWGLSRERYWGTPLPIWECTCGHRDAVGSIEEL